MGRIDKIGREKSFFPHEPNLTRNISREVLSKEFKPIATEDIQYENRHANNITLIELFAGSAYQHSNIKETVKICFI